MEKIIEKLLQGTCEDNSEVELVTAGIRAAIKNNWDRMQVFRVNVIVLTIDSGDGEKRRTRRCDFES